MSIILKQKHSLLGKNLLPLTFGLKDVEIQDEREFARLKKEHPLTGYSVEELETEFKNLTGEEAKEILSLVGKHKDINNVRLLVHVAICMANDVGAPRSTPIDISFISIQPGSRPSKSHEDEAVKDVKDGEKKKDDIETRLEKMESAIKEVTENTDKEVNLALKNISILARRPKLTAPAVMLAAVESLVDIAISSGHKEADYYAKALQTCRKFENNPDIFGLYQRLFGTADDKKISSVVAEWSRNEKYLDENIESKENVNSMSSVGFAGPHGSNFVSGSPNFPFWQSPLGAWQGMPMYGPMPARFPRHRSYVGGACYYFTRPGHIVAKCPKFTKEKDK